MKVIYDEATFGITCKSLKMLRDALAESHSHSITIAEIPTSDITCGFLIVDRDAQRAIWSGDGFRTDGGGEGGEGYRSAMAILKLFGFSPAEVLPLDPVDVNLFHSAAKRKAIELLKKSATILFSECWVGILLFSFFRTEATRSIAKAKTESSITIARVKVLILFLLSKVQCYHKAYQSYENTTTKPESDFQRNFHP